jgi:xylose isomerase
MSASIFSDVAPIRFEGPETDNELAYRYYDKKRVVLGKTMEEHLRFAVAFWHSFSWPGSDVFGAGTLDRPWLVGPVDQGAAETRLLAAFEFFERLDAPFFCFHDVDIAAEAPTVSTLGDNLKRIEPKIADHMARTGLKLLWGTANLFSHPRYMSGAMTSPNPDVFRCAALQVKNMMEMTHRLGGANYVFWGGREGYDTLLNTDLNQELDQMGRFLSMAVEHKHKIGFNGTLLIEPKPHEPSKHQYDRDAATCEGFLRRYGLEQEIKLNIEANHATLAGSSFEHEVAVAASAGLLGSIDINRGDPQNGWDTDQFHNDHVEMTKVWRHILKQGGLENGGFNFDAKLRRQSTDVADLFHAHVGGVDVLARGLLAAAAMMEDGRLEKATTDRYAGWQEEGAAAILAGDFSLDDVAAQAEGLNPKPISGGQERLENLVNRFV